MFSIFAYYFAQMIVGFLPIKFSDTEYIVVLFLD